MNRTLYALLAINRASTFPAFKDARSDSLRCTCHKRSTDLSRRIFSDPIIRTRMFLPVNPARLKMIVSWARYPFMEFPPGCNRWNMALTGRFMWKLKCRWGRKTNFPNGKYTVYDLNYTVNESLFASISIKDLPSGSCFYRIGEQPKIVIMSVITWYTHKTSVQDRSISTDF